MTKAQQRLRELRDRQSRERQRKAEFAQVDDLNDEQRGELDTIERATPDLERQIRASMVGLEDEEAEQRHASAVARAPEGDAKDRELGELRARCRVGNILAATLAGRGSMGPEACPPSAPMRQIAGIE